MIEVIVHGCVIAIWIILSFIYFRLDDIRDELRELNRRMKYIENKEIQAETRR